MPARKLPPNAELIAMYRSGMSCPEIGELTGCAGVTVQQALQRAGETLRTPMEAAANREARGRTKAARYWLGKQQPAEMVERRVSKIRGERHYAWKGGVERRPYRAVVHKDACVRCHTTEDLCIHHVDLDHYNNDPGNLQVLCKSCHMSLHKTAYWEAYHRGEPTPKSTGPSHWRKEPGP